MSSFFISIPSCRSPYAIVSARKKSPLRQGACLHLTRKLHAPAHAGVVHQEGQGKAAVIVGAVLVDVHLFGFHLLRVLSGKDAQKAQIVDADIQRIKAAPVAAAAPRFALSLIHILLYPLLRKKFSSTQVFYLSLLLALCGYGTLLVFCLTGLSHSLALLCIPGVVVFACNGMLTVLTTLFLSNSVDYGQLKTGRREESVIFSMQTFVVKAASGVAVFLTGIGLDLIGLVGNTEETGPVAVQSAGTLLGLRLMMTVLPMLVLAGALVLFRRKFVLTDARAAEISAQLHGEETHHD